MEQAIFTTENLRNVATTVDAMQTANKEMKRQYKNIDIDQLEVSVRLASNGHTTSSGLHFIWCQDA